jgi:DNA-binding transcriptional ArsR family regulator
VGLLNRILTSFRALGLDPYRRRITSLVATVSAKASVRAAIGGPDDMLNSLHPSIRWDGRELRLNTLFDADESLDGRPLTFQPTALASRITYNPLADSVIVSYPADAGPLTRDPQLDAPAQALVSLLGATKAAVLVTLVRKPGLTTGRLAAALGVSAAAASRHTAVLRQSGLVAALRNGQTVHHAPTRLGTDLVHGSTTDDLAEREPEPPSASKPAAA